MRALAMLLAGLWALAPRLARADSVESLQIEGEALAKAGHYGEAIEKFKAADKLEPRASHVCLIALAYTRLERWPQAEIFLARCHERATASDPLPDWVPVADAQLVDRLAASNAAAVEISVTPGDAGAELSVSSFAPDEHFRPRTIHLPVGHHVITARAIGYASKEIEIDITDRQPRHVVIAIRPSALVRARPSRWSWAVIGAGAALAAVAGIYDATAYSHARQELAATQGDPFIPGGESSYDAIEHRYETRRNIAIGLYAGAGAALVAGIALRYTLFRGELEVVARPTMTGGTIGLAWSR